MPKRPPRPTQQRTEYEKIVRARRVGKPIPETVVHGRESTYVNWKCRCEPCSAASNTARSSRHQRTKEDAES